MERARLEIAATELAAEAEARPRDGKRRLRRRLQELRELLAAVVPRGHPLYPLFWAEQLLCDEYRLGGLGLGLRLGLGLGLGLGF